MDPGIVAEAIRGLFSTAGVKQKSVVTAVGGRDVIVKKIQMDRMKEQDAREVIRWEAEQHVPFDMASVELDFQILDPDAEGLQMDVLLVAVKRELVEGRVGLVGGGGGAGGGGGRGGVCHPHPPQAQPPPPARGGRGEVVVRHRTGE